MLLQLTTRELELPIWKKDDNQKHKAMMANYYPHYLVPLDSIKSPSNPPLARFNHEKIDRRKSMNIIG